MNVKERQGPSVVEIFLFKTTALQRENCTVCQFSSITWILSRQIIEVFLRIVFHFEFVRVKLAKMKFNEYINGRNQK